MLPNEDILKSAKLRLDAQQHRENHFGLTPAANSGPKKRSVPKAAKHETIDQSSSVGMVAVRFRKKNGVQSVVRAAK